MAKFKLEKLNNLKENPQEIDIYLMDTLIARSKYIPLSKEYIDRFEKWDLKDVYINDEVSSDVDEDFDKFLKEYKAVSKIYFNCLARVKKNFNNFKFNNIVNIKEFQDIVSELQDIIRRNPNAMLNIFNIQNFSFEDEFFVRSINVSMLSIMMGMSLKLPSDRLKKLGLGGILYDIGTLRLPDKITKKIGNFTPEEFKEMQKHTVLGYKILKTNFRFEDDIALIPLTHHEYYNGSGYPRGVLGEKIHIYSRIVAIAQALEGMLRNFNRHLSRRCTLSEALKIIMNESGSKYDPKIVQTFVGILSLYPVGTIVVLNDGRRGLIFSSNRQYPMRPVVKIVADSSEQYIEDGEVVNLINVKNVFIKQLENNIKLLEEVQVRIFDR